MKVAVLAEAGGRCLGGSALRATMCAPVRRTSADPPRARKVGRRSGYSNTRSKRRRSPGRCAVQAPVLATRCPAVSLNSKSVSPSFRRSGPACPTAARPSDSFCGGSARVCAAAKKAFASAATLPVGTSPYSSASRGTHGTVGNERNAGDRAGAQQSEKEPSRRRPPRPWCASPSNCPAEASAPNASPLKASNRSLRR